MLRFEDMFAIGLPDCELFWPRKVHTGKTDVNIWTEVKSASGLRVPAGFLRTGQRAWLNKHIRRGRCVCVLGQFGTAWLAFVDDAGWQVLAKGGDVTSVTSFGSNNLDEVLQWLRQHYATR